MLALHGKKSASRPNSQPAKQPANQPAGQPANQPGCQHANQLARQPTSPTNQPIYTGSSKGSWQQGANSVGYVALLRGAPDGRLSRMIQPEEKNPLELMRHEYPNNLSPISQCHRKKFRLLRTQLLLHSVTHDLSKNRHRHTPEGTCRCKGHRKNRW